MAVKIKTWVWWLTIFANPKVHTTVYPHIYVSEEFYFWPKSLRERIIKHEEVHLKQQKEVGVFKYFFLYLFILPIFWNPWRYNWEIEAYTATGHSLAVAKKYLRKWNYGWLIIKE